MSEEKRDVIRCEHCGRAFPVGTKTCRSCGKTLRSAQTETQNEYLEGMPVKDWHEFIGKNSSRYVNLFRKHENKNFFFSFNVGAFFFRYTWMIYRKMYKEAFVVYLISLVLTVIFSVIGFLVYLPEYTEALEDFAPYTKYISTSGTRTEDYPTEDDPVLLKEVQSAYSAYSRVEAKAETSSSVFASVASFIVSVFTVLLSDWMYREHVLDLTVRKKGYVANSGKGGVALGVAILFHLFAETAINFIILGASILLLFILSSLGV